MHFSLPLLLSVLPLLTNGYVLKKTYKGKSLLSGFNFGSGGSQNGGIANYVDETTARNEGLIHVSRKHHGAVTLKTSTQQYTANRDSIRMISNDKYNQGLFIFDIRHMPAGCGNWPSIWLTGGGTWPEGGEIDVIEGVADFATNAMSTHTAAGCTQNPWGFSGEFMMSGSQQNDCNVYATSAQGCGVRSKNQASFGSALNKAGGGVFALKWDDGGIATYFFPRNAIPQDISSGNPNPGAWGTPENFVAPDACHPTQHFKDMTIIINNDICGTWPNGVWNQDTSYAGSPGSCAAKTGQSTCAAFAQNRGDAFSEAYWMDSPEPAAGTAVFEQVQKYGRLYQINLDRTTPHTLQRWSVTAALFVIFLIRILWSQAYYIVCYALGIYLLNLFLAFLQPKFDPSLAADIAESDVEEGAPGLPSNSNGGGAGTTYGDLQDGEFRPFIRRLPEFKFWYAATKAVFLSTLATAFPFFDIPVFWPILLIYFCVLFFITMRRQIGHMRKYKYLPFDLGKKAHFGGNGTGRE